MMATTFWHSDGTPMSAQQFLELLFGKLPEFFKNEAELRALWSDPTTRKKLLEGLAEAGFGHDQLAEMQKIIDAEKSDRFDVLAHVAYAMPALTRGERAAKAKVAIDGRFSAKQQIFLDFVLSHYVSMGVDELDQEKLTPLLRLKYHNSFPTPLLTLASPKRSTRSLLDSKSFFIKKPLVSNTRVGFSQASPRFPAIMRPRLAPPSRSSPAGAAQP
jgi:type I restriction enzyme R subunit